MPPRLRRRRLTRREATSFEPGPTRDRGDRGHDPPPLSLRHRRVRDRRAILRGFRNFRGCRSRDRIASRVRAGAQPRRDRRRRDRRAATARAATAAAATAPAATAAAATAAAVPVVAAVPPAEPVEPAAAAETIEPAAAAVEPAAFEFESVEIRPETTLVPRASLAAIRAIKPTASAASAASAASTAETGSSTAPSAFVVVVEPTPRRRPGVPRVKVILAAAESAAEPAAPPLILAVIAREIILVPRSAPTAAAAASLARVEPSPSLFSRRSVPIFFDVAARGFSFAAIDPSRSFLLARRHGRRLHARRVRERRDSAQEGLHGGARGSILRVDVLGVDVHDAKHVREFRRAHRRLRVIRGDASTAKIEVVHAEVRAETLERVHLLAPAAVALPAGHGMVGDRVQLALGEAMEHVRAVARKFKQQTFLVRVRQLHVLVVVVVVVRDVREGIVRQVHLHARGVSVGVLVDLGLGRGRHRARPLGGGHARRGFPVLAPPGRGVGRLEAVSLGHEFAEEGFELGPGTVVGPGVLVAGLGVRGGGVRVGVGGNGSDRARWRRCRRAWRRTRRRRGTTRGRQWLRRDRRDRRRRRESRRGRRRRARRCPRGRRPRRGRWRRGGTRAGRRTRRASPTRGTPPRGARGGATRDERARRSRDARGSIAWRRRRGRDVPRGRRRAWRTRAWTPTCGSLG